jgi:hypothetical protein
LSLFLKYSCHILLLVNLFPKPLSVNCL